MIIEVLDQMRRKVRLEHPARRIVSLVPSQTELLADLGLREELLGITKFCIHPEEVYKEKTKVGGTKNFHLDRIGELKPDLILGNKEENYQAGIEALEKDYPVWMSDIQNLEDALDMIQAVGYLGDRPAAAARLIKEIRAKFAQIPVFPKEKQPRVLYLIWRKPYMAAAGGTFIDAMLQLGAWSNVLAQESRYPEVSPSQIGELAPDYIFLSSEPYPFRQKHVEELEQVCPQAQVVLVDGELFSWYGSRLLHTAPYFGQLHKALVAPTS